VRVIPNKYPAFTLDDFDSAAPVSEDSKLHAAAHFENPTDDEALFVNRPARGRHEVVIESSQHVESFSRLSDDQAFWTFCAYRDRLRVFRQDFRLAAAAVFKNFGADAGASLVHAHSQAMGVPFVPESLGRELDGSAAFFRRHGRCVFCALAERETACEARVVAQSDRFVVICPYASRFAYEMWILPRVHAPHFESSDDAMLREAALLLRQVIQAMEGILDGPAYNFILHTSPFDTDRFDHYHWHIELFPRVSKAAGLEWGFAWHLNAVAPEVAALALRREI
jgi:UDPglucose--hexose-1-phosphate uridylyltransferase